MFGELFNSKYYIQPQLKQKQEIEFKKTTKTKEDLNNEIDTLITLYQTELLNSVLTYMKKIFYFTDESKFDNDIELLNNIINKYYIKKVHINFNKIFNTIVWKKYFDTYPGLLESFKIAKHNFIQQLFMNSKKLSNDLKVEILEMEGLDEQDIVKDFYTRNVKKMITYNLYCFEGEIKNAVRSLVYY